jgi:hypothetical protein
LACPLCDHTISVVYDTRRYLTWWRVWTSARTPCRYELGCGGWNARSTGSGPGGAFRSPPRRVHPEEANGIEAVSMDKPRSSLALVMLTCGPITLQLPHERPRIRAD